jgi:hypothetical protein
MSLSVEKKKTNSMHKGLKEGKTARLSISCAKTQNKTNKKNKNKNKKTLFLLPL